MAAELRTAPADLTQLAKKNGGVFPEGVVENIIDGRKTLRAHGTYDMPVWGNVFTELQPSMARERILHIVEYLKGLQAP